MRFGLLLFFCTIGLSASAQWWHIKLNFNLNLKKHEVLSVLPSLKDNSISHLSLNSKSGKLNVQPLVLSQSQYSLEVAEVAVMKQAKHNMRFRIYNEASYNFSDLAQLYIQLNRLSEAKWYFLQSNQISREQNDDKHTILNLVSLAEIKVALGDKASACADLLEARDFARVRGMQISAVEIDEKIRFLEQSRTISAKPDVKYAETMDTAKKVFR
jgi:hypothetical protein